MSISQKGNPEEAVFTYVVSAYALRPFDDPSACSG
jgi:hypothetical protein